MRLDSRFTDTGNDELHDRRTALQHYFSLSLWCRCATSLGQRMSTRLSQRMGKLFWHCPDFSRSSSSLCQQCCESSNNHAAVVHGCRYSQNQICVWKYPSMAKLATLTGHTMRWVPVAHSIQRRPGILPHLPRTLLTLMLPNYLGDP
jgi:hypothetical protein